MITKGENGFGGVVRNFGIDMYILLYLKWIIIKDLLYSIVKSAQYHVTIQMGKKLKINKYVSMYI